MKHGFMVRDLELYRGLCRSGERGRREKKVTWNRLFCDVHKSDQNLTSRHQIKLTVDGNGNTLGRRSRSGLEMKGGQEQVNAIFRARWKYALLPYAISVNLMKASLHEMIGGVAHSHTKPPKKVLAQPRV